jgi:multisubunit Na+/H+ antiporter MnhE subunit
MIRGWNFWVNTLILTSQYNPPWFIEWLMLTLSMIMVVIWLISSQLPYMVLGLSFMVGTSISMLVREAIAPSHQTRITQILALLLLVVSIYWFADLL